MEEMKESIMQVTGGKSTLEFVQDILARIADSNFRQCSYSSDKMTIKEVFKATEGSSVAGILARLTLIDSLYSTQLNRRYYGLDDLSQAIALYYAAGKDLKQLFLDFAANPDASIFDIPGEDGKTHNLFAENYGIGKKNAEEKGHALSLISKYAYFLTDCRFPIYDSIAREIYPLIWDFCGFEKKEKVVLKEPGADAEGRKKAIENFVKAINNMIDHLGGNVDYDILDRLLWFTGKVKGGNLSLILSKDEYKKFAVYLKEKGKWCPKKDKVSKKTKYLILQSLL